MPEMQETEVQSLSQENPLEQEMATQSSILAWKILQTGEPGRPQGPSGPVLHRGVSAGRANRVGESPPLLIREPLRHCEWPGLGRERKVQHTEAGESSDRRQGPQRGTSAVC